MTARRSFLIGLFGVALAPLCKSAQAKPELIAPADIRISLDDNWKEILEARARDIEQMRALGLNPDRLLATFPLRENGPPSGAFVPASWRGTGRVNPVEGGVIAVSFDTSEGVVRLLLNIDSARSAAESLLCELRHYSWTNSQSKISLGAPSDAVSTPDEGRNV